MSVPGQKRRFERRLTISGRYPINGHHRTSPACLKRAKSRPSEAHSERNRREEVSSKAELDFPNKAFSVNHYLAGKTNPQGESTARDAKRQQ
jgi:hypothetical protein